MQHRWERLLPFEQLLADDTDGTNPAIITALFKIDTELTKAWALRHIAAPLTTHPRFCSVLSGRRQARFKPVPGFTSDSDLLDGQVTLHSTTLTPAALDAVLSSPLSKERPLWHIDMFTTPGAQTTEVIFRVHHVVGDGVGLVRFFLSSVAETTSTNAAPSAAPARPARRAVHDALAERAPLLSRATRPIRDSFSTLFMPLVPDTRCVLTREPMSGSKRAAFARPRDVSSLLVASRSVGVSINDLMLAAACGAVRAYALEEGDTARSLRRVRVGVPFNRHAASGDFVHNAVVVLQLLAPLCEESRIRRLADVVRQTRDLKRGSRVRFSLIAFALVSMLPMCCRSSLWRHITRSASLLLSNVPGPLAKVRVGGKAVCDIRILAPSQGLAGMTVSAISYAGTFNVGVYTDTSRVAQPSRLLELYDEELDLLLAWTKEVGNVGANW